MIYRRRSRRLDVLVAWWQSSQMICHECTADFALIQLLPESILRIIYNAGA
jgi:hypothetical protein